MRVLYLTHNYPRFEGDSSGAFIEELLRALPRKNIFPYVLCPHAEGLKLEEKREGIQIFRFRYGKDDNETLAYEGKMLAAFKKGPKELFSLSSFLGYLVKQTRRIVQEARIDLVHAHWLLPAGLAARIALTSKSTPLLLSVHGTDVRLIKGIPFGAFLARWILRRVRLLLPVSGFLGDSLEAMSGKHVPRYVLPMPASSVFISPLRKRLSRRIVAVGNLTPQKRFHVLLQALGILSREGMMLELTLVGDGPERKSLEAITVKEGLTQRVRLLGKLPHHELPRILNDAGVMVLPSVAEGFGVALVEAQLSGLAVIGTDAGGQREIITHQKTGVLVEPDNPQALAGAIEKLYTNETQTLRMAARGQETAKARFLARPTADLLASIYKRILP